MDIQVKRVYEPVSPNDGVRILVDGIWPRGIKKDKLQAELWLKDAAPSTALRKWFGHERMRWDEFKKRYFAELDAKPEVVAGLLDLAQKGRLTLLFSARDIECNQALALREYLLSRAREAG